MDWMDIQCLEGEEDIAWDKKNGFEFMLNINFNIFRFIL